MSTVTRSALPLLATQEPSPTERRPVRVVLPSTPRARPDDLLRQAGRLRFREAATEARYEAERFGGAVMRERVTMAGCALVTSAIGLFEAFYTTAYRFEGVVMALHVLRFYFVLPLWVGLFLLTFSRGFSRWAGPANAIVTTLSCWGHSVMVWVVARANPNVDLVNALTGATILVLIVATLLLPMRFRALVLTVIGSNAGALIFFYLTLGADPRYNYNLKSPTLSLTLVGILVMVGGFFREAADRRLFAQRENARVLADELATANAELARMNAEKNEFMAIAAHDLRAPLAAVRGYLELLATGRLSGAADQARALREMRVQSERMLALVTDYLSVHAAESGQMPVRITRTDLGAIVTSAYERHWPAAAAKQQRLDAQALATPLWVRADIGLLNQVADNFVTNALKFSPHGATIQIEVQVAETVRRARLAVIDAGPGISAEDQARLFRKFSRTEARPTGGEVSTGLGLAVSKRLAEAMGGRVGCESEEGAGATFWVELPMAE